MRGEKAAMDSTESPRSSSMSAQVRPFRSPRFAVSMATIRSAPGNGRARVMRGRAMAIQAPAMAVAAATTAMKERDVRQSRIRWRRAKRILGF